MSTSVPAAVDSELADSVRGRGRLTTRASFPWPWPVGVWDLRSSARRAEKRQVGMMEVGSPSPLPVHMLCGQPGPKPSSLPPSCPSALGAASLSLEGEGDIRWKILEES